MNSSPVLFDLGRVLGTLALSVLVIWLVIRIIGKD